MALNALPPSPATWLAQLDQPSLHLALLVFLTAKVQQRHLDGAQFAIALY
jgi:hypothetical protein